MLGSVMAGSGDDASALLRPDGSVTIARSAVRECAVRRGVVMRMTS